MTKELQLTIHANPAGYSVGTFEYRITDAEGNMSFDGGYQSPELARRAGKAAMKRIAGTGELRKSRMPSTYCSACRLARSRNSSRPRPTGRA